MLSHGAWTHLLLACYTCPRVYLSSLPPTSRALSLRPSSLTTDWGTPAPDNSLIVHQTPCHSTRAVESARNLQHSLTHERGPRNLARLAKSELADAERAIQVSRHLRLGPPWGRHQGTRPRHWLDMVSPLRLRYALQFSTPLCWSARIPSRSRFTGLQREPIRAGQVPRPVVLERSSSVNLHRAAPSTRWWLMHAHSPPPA